MNLSQPCGTRSKERRGTSYTRGTPAKVFVLMIASRDTCPCSLGSEPSRPHGLYRGTSLIRNSAPLGPYSRTMLRALWWYWGEGLSFMSAISLYGLHGRECIVAMLCSIAKVAKTAPNQQDCRSRWDFQSLNVIPHSCIEFQCPHVVGVFKRSRT